jgi:hypothetical protein
MPFGLVPLAPGFPSLPRSPSLHAVPTTPADRIGAYRSCCSALPHQVLPDSLWPSQRTHPVGIHTFMFRGLLRLHSRYGLQFCSPTLSGLCHEAPARTVPHPDRSSATQAYRFLLAWDSHPLVICAIRAHVCDISVEPFELVTEPRPEGSATTSAASPAFLVALPAGRGPVFDRSYMLSHFYVGHPGTSAPRQRPAVNGRIMQVTQ